MGNVIEPAAPVPTITGGGAPYPPELTRLRQHWYNILDLKTIIILLDLIEGLALI
jgi:hypothetical protein